MKLPASKISCFEVEDTEGIKAYLRILPALQDDTEYAEPYIHVLNETQILMKPPRACRGRWDVQWALGRRVGASGSDASPTKGGGGPGRRRRACGELWNHVLERLGPSAGGKYVAGLSEHRVTAVQEAQALLQRGTENCIVFGTLANRMSSRSHGVFMVKIIREHAGAAAAAASGTRVERELYTSRLSI
ncbi:hypothetical protein OC844_008049, partial [Tilletia horrida]